MNEQFVNEVTDVELDEEIERMSALAVKFGLNPEDNQTATDLCYELSRQLDKADRRESTVDVVQATVEAVAARAQAKSDLDAIRTVYGREPTIAENLRAGYKRPQPVEPAPQPPAEGATPLENFNYYYKHLARKE
jgi:hypothetical protein